MEHELVGAGHQGTVELLEQRLQSIRNGEPVPRVVVLEGESGVGKTRIVRELYTRLQAAQPAPPYWPALDVSTPAGSGARVDPMPSRKVLGPPIETFAWPAEALPAYLWWAISCDSMQEGAAINEIRMFEAAMHAHLVPLSLARAQQEGVRKSLIETLRRNIAAELLKATREGTIEAAGKVLEAIGTPVPGLGWLVNQAMQGWSWSRTSRQHRRLARDGGSLAELNRPATTPAEDMVDTLRQVLVPALPAIIVIEDLHLMSDSLGELLGHLARTDLPILVVGTAWPEGRHKETYAGWLDTATRHGQVERVEVDRLADEDLTTLVRRAVPQVDDDTAGRIVRRWPNPLALLLILSMDKFRRGINRTGTLDISDDELRAFPGTLQGIYRARWEELPEDAREAMLLAAAGMGRDEERGMVHNAFLSEVIVRAAITSGLTDAVPASAADDVQRHPLTAGMSRAADPLAWLVDTHPVTQFRDPILIDTVFLDLHDTFRQNEVTAYRQAIVDLLCAQLDAAREDGYWLNHDDPHILAVATWLHALTEDTEPSTLDEEITRSTAAICMAFADAAAFRYASALDLADQSTWSTTWRPEHADTLTAHILVAHWRGESGDVAGALSSLQTLLADRGAAPGTADPFILIIRGAIASWRGVTGNAAGALAESGPVSLIWPHRDGLVWPHLRHAGDWL